MNTLQAQAAIKRRLAERILSGVDPGVRLSDAVTAEDKHANWLRLEADLLDEAAEGADLADVPGLEVV